MRKAFTLIEISVVIGIMVILASLTLPLGANFYKSQQLETEAQAVSEVLRRAQLKAVVQERDSQFGVYFGSGSYVLFQGGSFAGRDSQHDESFDFSSTLVDFGGLSEIVFSKMAGQPSVAGDITLTSGNNSRVININSLGRINLE